MALPSREVMQVVAITGAAGYIGSRVAQCLCSDPTVRVRGLYRRAGPPAECGDRYTAVRGDLADHAALARLLEPGCAVVNCAYDSAAGASANLAAAETLGDACLERGVGRLVHCSTAVVVGSTSAARIDESTRCDARTEYERTKLEIERVLARKARQGFELAILRPTAVFGPGSRNLLKLAHALSHGARFANWLRSCLNDRRRMNLVAVENVVAAIAFLLRARGPFDGEAFIVSDDEAEANNFRDVELGLVRALGIPDYALPRVPLPPAALSIALRLRGRSLTDPRVVFAGDKLTRLGFRKPASFESSLAAFAHAYAAAQARTGTRLA